MKTLKKSSRSLVLGLLLLLPVFPGGAEERRQERLDLYVIIDGSPALEGVKTEVLAWFSDYIVDKIIQDGDRLTLWLAAGQGELVFSGALEGAESRESLKETFHSLKSPGKPADFAGALRAALQRARTEVTSGGLPAYILLITASAGGLSPSLEGSAGSLLRYSRVEEFPGWRVFRVGADIGALVQEAAAAYLSN
jgi:hypothetical protein